MNLVPFNFETDTLTPELIVRELKQLPSAPKLLPRLKQLLRDANSSMDEIVALIRLDPGISARVLQVGNSAYFSKGLRCVSVEEAVNRVGYDQVYDLVSYAVASQVLVRPLAVYAIEADELWRQSVACAVAAEFVAAECGEDRCIAYTLGLLHGIGMVAIDEWALRHGPTLVFTWKNVPREYTESERALLGFTQADVGGELLRTWDFPVEMWEPLRWQYAPRSSAGYVRMASVLHVAKWLRTYVCAGDKDPLPPLPDPVLLSPIRLTHLRLTKLVVDVRKRMAQVKSLIEVA